MWRKTLSKKHLKISKVLQEDFKLILDICIDGKKIQLVDDYGHHPTELAATIQAAREAYPEQRLVVLFQPHRYSRTRDLFDDFVRVLNETDALDVV